MLQVNLDSKTRLKTLDNMQSPDKDTFDAAQKRIQNLMEKDSYPRFLNSDVYQDMLGDHRHKLKLKSWENIWENEVFGLKNFFFFLLEEVRA